MKFTKVKADSSTYYRIYDSYRKSIELCEQIKDKCRRIYKYGSRLDLLSEQERLDILNSVLSSLDEAYKKLDIQ